MEQEDVEEHPRVELLRACLKVQHHMTEVSPTTPSLKNTLSTSPIQDSCNQCINSEGRKNTCRPEALRNLQMVPKCTNCRSRSVTCSWTSSVPRQMHAVKVNIHPRKSGTGNTQMADVTQTGSSSRSAKRVRRKAPEQVDAPLEVPAPPPTTSQADQMPTADLPTIRQQTKMAFARVLREMEREYERLVDAVEDGLR